MKTKSDWACASWLKQHSIDRFLLLDSIAASLFVWNWMIWQIVRRLRQPLPRWSRIFDGLHLQENSSQADFFFYSSPWCLKSALDGLRLSYFYHRGAGNGFSITVSNSEMLKIGEGFVSEVMQYFSVFHSQFALHAALPLAPFWGIFNICCAKKVFIGTALTDKQLRLDSFQCKEWISLPG